MGRIAKYWANFRKKPYIEIVSEGGNGPDGYPLELDWNDLFIADLAKSGIDGDSEEEMARAWLQRIMRAIDYDLYQEQLMATAELAEREKTG